MRRRAYFLCLSASLWIYATVVTPTTRPHRMLVSDFPLYGARGILLALPFVLAAGIAVYVGKDVRTFPDFFAGYSLVAMGGLTYGLTFITTPPEFNLQLLALAVCVLIVGRIHIGRSRREQVA